MTDKLKALALAATPGPWTWDGNVCDYDKENEAPWLVSSEVHPPVLGGTITCARHNDASYIAAASPDAILALIKRAEDAEADYVAMSMLADEYKAEVERLKSARLEELDRRFLLLQEDNAQLQARVNAMESQEPTYWEYKGNLYQNKPNLIDDARPLFAAPGAAPKPPHECKTEAERVAYDAGWWKALESVRLQEAQKKETDRG